MTSQTSPRVLSSSPVRSLPLAAVADSVYLKNGQSFEGVEAVVAEDYVRIDLAIGSMRLPMSQVDRIEEVDSTLGEYRARETELGRQRRRRRLARARAWARANDFEQGALKAALVAARLDPELPGARAADGEPGLPLRREAHEWLPYDDAMRRQGLVEDRRLGRRPRRSASVAGRRVDR